MAAVLLVADVLDADAGSLFDALGIDAWAADLAGYDDAIGGGERLADDLDLVGVDASYFTLGEEELDDLFKVWSQIL